MEDAKTEDLREGSLPLNFSHFNEWISPLDISMDISYHNLR